MCASLQNITSKTGQSHDHVLRQCTVHIIGCVHEGLHSSICSEVQIICTFASFVSLQTLSPNLLHIVQTVCFELFQVTGSLRAIVVSIDVVRVLNGILWGLITPG